MTDNAVKPSAAARHAHPTETLEYTPIDLSHKLEPNTTSWPGLPNFECCPLTSVANDGFSLHKVSMGSHLGTHVDAPSHFIADGASIDQIPVERLFGPAVIVDLTSKKERGGISWERDLKVYFEGDRNGIRQKIDEKMILVLYTGWSKYWKEPEKYYQHPYLEVQAAEEIAERGVKAIGLDFASLDDSGKGVEGGFPVHKVILGAGIPMIENLTNVGKLVEDDDDGSRTIVSLIPLNFAGCDGAQVRALGWKELRG
ncbi:hypothetical protein D9758_004357 [Tetrapyrgos nigripes]|uniref:Cyclase n=1 Tax=Tetrapyrgos nigripes TaxID=182062 RepID=A0A8H5GNL5_9AGAR|nr:hypothetical protein D9758_004357 [Tetrapyrgos nigripes]